MRSFFLMMAGVLVLAGCDTNPELGYCKALGVGPGSSEFGNCTQYYFQQEAAFQADRDQCSAEADMTYPQSLYSGWGWAHVHGGMYGGRWHSAEMVEVPPDYEKNAQIDQLRDRIIEPCMQARGWVSGRDWRAGHRPVAAPRPARTADGLPWLK